MTEQQSEPIHLKPGEVSRRLKATLKEHYPQAIKDKQMIVRVEDSNYGRIVIAWRDGPTIPKVQRFFEAYHDRRSYHPAIITDPDGTRYASYVHIRYTRSFSLDFLRRCSTVYCRQNQIPLPEFMVTASGAHIKPASLKPGQRVFILDDATGRAIENYAASINADALEAIEQETIANFPPLPEIGEAEAERRAEWKEAEKEATVAEMERRRWYYEYQFRVFAGIGEERETEATTIRILLDRLQWWIRQHAPLSFGDPVICAGCFKYAERDQCSQRNTGSTDLFICRACQANPQARLLPADQLIEEKEPEAFQFERNKEGIYIGKNREHVPVLTRDLLHDCRVSKWWLRFEYKPGKEVREALHSKGWSWGPGRRQWYNSNQFGVLRVPEIIFEEYGGYVDGGYCVYRQQRGERLRTYAGKVRGKADAMEEWSNKIVAEYMATGAIVTGGRRSRKLQREKSRAERKAAMARWLDQYAEELQRRANSSENYQAYLASTPMLSNRIETLEAERRLAHKHFNEAIPRAAEDYTSEYRLSSGRGAQPVAGLLKAYENMLERQEIIDEEINLLKLTLHERQAGEAAEPAEPEAQAIEVAPERSFAVGGVIEVNVGRDNPTDLYPTPPAVGYQLLTDASFYPIPADARYILEPNGGTAALLRQIIVYCQRENIQAEVHTCEILWELNQKLTAWGTLAGWMVKATDFLAYKPEGFLYDATILNPPFSRWLDHMEHACEVTRKGGTVNAVLSASCLSDTSQRGRHFRDLVEARGKYLDLPPGAFRMSNTNVAIKLVSIRL